MTLTSAKSEVLRREIQRRIADALHHAAGLEAERINVLVDGSRVILEGVVPATSHRDALTTVARGTPGVSEIMDLLRVSSEEG